MDDHANSDPAEASRSPERAYGFAHKDVRRILIGGAGWLWVLVTGVLWSLQPWQRPWITRIPDEGIWLTLSCLGLLALIAFPWRRQSLARFLRRTALVLVSGALLFVGMPVFCDTLAVEKLESILEEEISLHMKQMGTGLRVHNDTLAKKLQDALKTIGVESPEWLDKRARNNATQQAHSFIASSSWSVRRHIADAMVRDSTRADYLMAFWKEYFPCLTGPDVTLECRRDWLQQLDILRKEPSHSLSTRQATLLMMALIVLTDPPAFEAWRGPVRDEMIHLREPLIHRWTGESQTFWHRALDALLALDPPESWTRLAAPMVVEGAAFRQAMEVPVRGLIGNFDAFLPIFENGKDHNDLFLFWQSAGASLADYPESLDAQTAERIRTWRRDTLFRWLMAQGDGSKDDWTQRRIPVIATLGHYPVPPCTDTQQEQLVSAAEELIRKIQQLPSGDVESAYGYLNRIRHILPYLNDENADALCKLLVPFLLQPGRFTEKHFRSYTFDGAWADCWWFLQSRMTDEQRLLLRDQFIPLMANTSCHHRSYHALLYIDAWAKYPALSRAQWLARAWSLDGLWKIGPKETSCFPNRFEQRPILTIPEVSEKDIDTFARILEFNLRDEHGKDIGQILAERLLVTDARNGTSRVIGRIRQRMIRLGIHSGANREWLKKELRIDLAGMGLYRINGDIAESFLEKATQRQFLYAALFYQPDLADNLWSVVFTNPKWAARVVTDCLEGVYGDHVLNSMILAIDRSAPGDEVIGAVWDALRAGSYGGENRRKVFGALFRLSHRVSASERQSMRRDYIAALSDRTFGNLRNDWGYHTTASYYMSYSGASFTYPTGCDPDPLAHAGGGIGIAWEEDELSARFSWRTMVDRQFYRQPLVGPSSRSHEVFPYVVHGFDSDSQLPSRNPPPQLTQPFPPTPWQKARALYLKHPDLEFE